MINFYAVLDRYRFVEALLADTESVIGQLDPSDARVLLWRPAARGLCYQVLWLKGGLWISRVRLLAFPSYDDFVNRPHISSNLDPLPRHSWRKVDLNDLVAASPALELYEKTAAELLRRHLVYVL